MSLLHISSLLPIPIATTRGPVTPRLRSRLQTGSRRSLLPSSPREGSYGTKKAEWEEERDGTVLEVFQSLENKIKRFLGVPAVVPWLKYSTAAALKRLELDPQPSAVGERIWHCRW